MYPEFAQVAACVAAASEEDPDGLEWIMATFARVLPPQAGQGTMFEVYFLSITQEEEQTTVFVLREFKRYSHVFIVTVAGSSVEACAASSSSQDVWRLLGNWCCSS